MSRKRDTTSPSAVVGTAGVEPAVFCTPSRRINHFPTSRNEVLVRDPGLAPGLFLLPTQAGRYLPMSLEWSGLRGSNPRSPAPEAGGFPLS